MSFNSFTLSLLNKVTIGTYNFVFVILNIVLVIVDITQSLLQFSSRWVLQLNNGISKDPQKQIKYFSGTATFPFSNTLLLSTAVNSFMRLDLYLKYVESAIISLKQVAHFDFPLILFFEIGTNLFLETCYLCVFHSFCNL